MSIQTPDTNLRASASPREKLPRRWVFMFKDWGAPMVARGDKTQTCRPDREEKYMPKVGDIADLRKWSGKPYRSKQAMLGEGVIVRIAKIKIYVADEIFYLDDEMFAGSDADVFAKADGFECAADFFAFFRKEYGKHPVIRKTGVWRGFVTYWELSPGHGRNRDGQLPVQAVSADGSGITPPVNLSNGGAETRGGK